MKKILFLSLLVIFALAAFGCSEQEEQQPTQTTETNTTNEINDSVPSEPNRFSMAADGSWNISAQEAAQMFSTENSTLNLAVNQYDTPMPFYAAENDRQTFAFLPNENGNLVAVFGWMNGSDNLHSLLLVEIASEIETFLGGDEAWSDYIINHFLYPVENSLQTNDNVRMILFSDDGTAETVEQYCIMRNSYVEEYNTGTNETTTQEQVDPPTLGEQNALEQAFSYLAYSAFSYDGLIHQLEYEGYTTEEATYAADHCGADWNEQAALQAASYLKYSSFSRQGLIDQLIYEGFTQEQAEYGVSQVGY